MQWGPVSSASSIHDSSSSVITSSEGGVPSLKNQTDFLEGRDLSDQQMDKVLHVRSCAKIYKLENFTEYTMESLEFVRFCEPLSK